MFDSYPGLPHTYIMYTLAWNTCISTVYDECIHAHVYTMYMHVEQTACSGLSIQSCIMVTLCDSLIWAVMAGARVILVVRFPVVPRDKQLVLRLLISCCIVSTVGKNLENPCRFEVSRSATILSVIVVRLLEGCTIKPMTSSV